MPVLAKRTGALIAIVLALATGGCGRSGGSLLLLDELPEVGTIRIVGAEAFGEGAVRSLMSLHGSALASPFSTQRFSERQLDSDVLAILTFYNRHGYLRARVTTRQVRPRGNKRDITLTVDEGDQILVGAMVILGAPGVSRSDLQATGLAERALRDRVANAENEPLDPFGLTEDRRALLRAFADRGYLLADVDVNVKFLGNRALVFFQVDPGDRYTVDAVAFSGNRMLPEGVLNRQVDVEPGRLYRQDEIVRSQQQLLQAGYFTDVRWDTVGVDRSARTVGLEFSVRERKMKWLEGGVGISSENQIRLTGTWGTRNLFRRGARFAFINRTDLDMDRSVGSYVDEHRSDLLIRFSRVLGTHWEGQPNLSYVHDRESDYRQNILGAGVDARRILGDIRDQLVLSFENRWVYNDADSAAAVRDVQLTRDRYQTRVVSGRIQLDSRNDFFNPSKGTFHELRLDLAGGVIGGNNGYRKATGSIRKFIPLVPERLVMAWRMQVGGIDATSEGPGGEGVANEAELVPTEDRYRLGGANTIRGFDQDELDGAIGSGEIEGGVFSLLGNLEARLSLFWRFSLVTFLDAGNVWQDDGELALDLLVPHADGAAVTEEDVRYTYGAGLRVATPVGPVRLDYARKWNIPTASDEDRYKIHVSLGHAF